MSVKLGFRSAVMLIALTLLARPGIAQPGRRVTRPAAELLAGVVAVAEGLPSPACDDIIQVLAYPESYPSAELDAFLTGLEGLALHDDDSRVRISAVVKVYSVGQRGKQHPIPGTVDRLERIYVGTEDGSVRNAVLFLIPGVAERNRALEFLKARATEGPGTRGFPWSVRNAVGALARMGDEGGAVLRRLHQSGTVLDPEARQDLSAMANRDFRTE